VSPGEVVGALDVGGTHVAAGRVDLASASVDPSSRVRAPLPASGGRVELVGAISAAARSVARSETRRFCVAVPGPFDYEAGVSAMSHKLRGLYGVNLRDELGAALGGAVSISFLNDAEAFVLGEWWAGAARGHGRVLGITLGTGLGSAFLVDGSIVTDGAGTPPAGALYRLAFRDAPVEETLSAGGLLAGYRPGGADGVGVEQIAALGLGGDDEAAAVFAAFAAALGEFLEPWLVGFEPSCLVVGGSIARAWALLDKPLRSALDGVGRLETVTVASHVDDAPLLGAARRLVEDET
jgi:glucokinase